jgi:hypothetical protein
MSGDQRSEIILLVRDARIKHAKSVDTMPDGEVNDLDHLGRTLDSAIADAVFNWMETQLRSDQNCGVCEGAGFNWRRAADESRYDQVEDFVDYYRCPCVEVVRLRAEVERLIEKKYAEWEQAKLKWRDEHEIGRAHV